MKVNVGSLDKTLRVVVGVVLLVLTATQTIGLWGLIGVVPLLTGLFNFCPLYTLFGIKTCKVK
ncbi:DUF2892 domain-containing protein [Salinispirillum marinum]|uniref:DUF2892 domain-containing protein n=2 Tax=Saccharospirillaceae TaxID=255527 RepID=A0ABV8BIX7_9GAMM